MWQQLLWLIVVPCPLSLSLFLVHCLSHPLQTFDEIYGNYMWQSIGMRFIHILCTKAELADVALMSYVHIYPVPSTILVQKKQPILYQFFEKQFLIVSLTLFKFYKY